MSHPSDSNSQITPLPLSPGARRIGSEDDTSPGTPTPVGVEPIPFVEGTEAAGKEMGTRPRTLTPGGTRRVEPNPDKPRVSGRKERKLAPADALSAQGYDALELAGEAVKVIWRDVADAIAVATTPDLKPSGDGTKGPGGGR